MFNEKQWLMINDDYIIMLNDGQWCLMFINDGYGWSPMIDGQWLFMVIG